MPSNSNNNSHNYDNNSSSGGKWREVSRERPCPVCGKDHWCSMLDTPNGLVKVNCQRKSEGGHAEQDCNGNSYWVHTFNPDGSRAKFTPQKKRTRRARRKLRTSTNRKSSKTAKKPQQDQATDEFAGLEDNGITPDAPADLEFRYQVYSTLLKNLTLSAPHKEKLLDRGFSKEATEHNAYRSIASNKVRRTTKKLYEKHGNRLFNVPGFHLKDGSPVCRLFGDGIVIPVRNHLGQIIALKKRADEPWKGNRYFWLSAKGKGGKGPGNPLHVPRKLSSDLKELPEAATLDRLRITEGEFKADICQELDPQKIPTISVPGVTNWQVAMPFVRKVEAKTVHIAYDMDLENNKNVRKTRDALGSELLSVGCKVFVETWDHEKGKGIDDALAAGATIEVAEFVPPPPPRKNLKEESFDPEEVVGDFLEEALLQKAKNQMDTHA